MLTMHPIGMPPNVFRFTSTKPREEHKQRLNLVQGFFEHLEAPHELRRASLVLQLTGGVEALTAARRTDAAHADEPVTVSLVNWEEHRTSSSPACGASRGQCTWTRRWRLVQPRACSS